MNIYQCSQDTSCWLKLSTIEWQQVDYLIMIINVFHNYTLVFLHEIESLLSIVFFIYNSVFNHLKSLHKWLKKKQKSWKHNFYNVLNVVYTKLSKYYHQTYKSKRYFYIMTIILSHQQKLKEFQFKKWVDEYDWFVEYDNIFRKLFHHYIK